MKKLLLVFTLFIVFQTAKAQDFEYGAPGYEVSFLPGEASSTCYLSFTPNMGGYAYVDGNIAGATLSAAGLLKVTSNPEIRAALAPGFFDLPLVLGDNCVNMRTSYVGNLQDANYYHINMSGGNSIVLLRAQANVPTTIHFALAYSAGGYPGTTSSYYDTIVKTVALTPEMTTYELDFSDWPNRGKVNCYGLSLTDPNVTVSIEKISFGAAAWPSYSNRIKGNLYEDLNNDCTKQMGEKGLSNVIIEVSDGQNSYHGYTDGEGNYTIGVDSGTVTYLVKPNLNNRQSSLLSNVCQPGHIVNANGSGQEFCCSDFAMKVTNCSLLSVEINSDRRRRCFRSNTVVSYKNYGNTDASSAVVKVVYPDYVKPISSVPDWSSQIGDTLVYNIGTLAAGASGTIALIDSVVCWNESIRGLAQCTKAFISPKAQCVSNEPAWDGSSVTVFPYCENGVARFVVQNVGLEDMASSSAYRLYSNDTLVFQSTFQLISGNTFQVRYPANGAVIRLEADQRPSHPGRSQPRAFVQDCGTAAAQTSVASESLVLSVPQDDLDEELAISCLTIVDSYDPNDKAALPVGMTDDHLVKAGTPLKYTIRFQNTGSDVAYKVVVVDTLDNNLDLATFTETSASHPYVLKVTSAEEKMILTYTFNNINLKDSTTSEPESHGFLSFYINAKEDLADGNTIHNKADIFFDYNSAIVTNVVDHTIGTYVPMDLTKGNSVQVTTGLFDGQATNIVQRVTLYPNPASDMVQVKLDQQFSNGQITILDLSGHEVWSGALKGEITAVSLSGLSSGMYMYKVMSNGEYVGVGKLLVK
ncbi:MAG: hypothetical protein K0R51_3554 [Cytophagaceae bacterium]|jgi:uncharacterized repeat protein (TIGR01451 family)|nr:hypothetical protein [Cytophagaceae bacterium]